MSNNQEKLNEQLFNVIADEKVSDEARLKKIKYLVYLGADVNAKDENGNTPLIQATRGGDLEVVKCLVQNGADVNVRLYGKSVLSKAIEQNAGAEVQEFLREKGAIEWVISKEEAKKLSQGFWNDKGDLKSSDEIKELLKKGADVNASNKYGDTALMMAVYNGHLEVVKYLAECGVDVNASDKHGRTALMNASENGHLEVVKYLVERGAQLDIQDKNGWTALIGAARGGYLEVVKYLVQNGADVNAQNKYGRTALMIVAYNGEIDVVKYLAENGANLRVIDKDGWTALDMAKFGYKDDCVKFLEEAKRKALAQKGQSAKMGVSPIVKADEGR